MYDAAVKRFKLPLKCQEQHKKVLQSVNQALVKQCVCEPDFCILVKIRSPDRFLNQNKILGMTT